MLDGDAYVFAYFRQTYGGRVETTEEGGAYQVSIHEAPFADEALHLAWSLDGIHWEPLHGNRPIVDDPERRFWVRDPFIGRGPDGLFHLIGTGGGAQDTFLYTRSANLIDWEPARGIPVMRSVPRAINVWAPEWVYLPESGEYFVVWSSSFGKEGWDDSRIWCSRTRDWTAFTPPQVLFDPGFTVIDATLAAPADPADSRWHLFYKDERFGHRHGEHRQIRAAVAGAVDGPYAPADAADVPLTPTITEGPTVFRGPGGRWHLIFDYCMDDRFGLLVSGDLQRWTPVPEASFPANARHGSVVAVTREELDLLRQRLG